MAYMKQCKKIIPELEPSKKREDKVQRSTRNYFTYCFPSSNSEKHLKGMVVLLLSRPLFFTVFSHIDQNRESLNCNYLEVAYLSYTVSIWRVLLNILV